MIWRRTSADSDGFLNGEQRFNSRQNRVPGAEANPTAILRNSCKTRPIVPCSPGYPPTTTVRVIFTTSSEANQLNRYLFRSLTKKHDPLPQRTPHSSLRYSIHIRNISDSHFWTPSASSLPTPFVICLIRPCLLTLILSPGLIPFHFLHTSQFQSNRASSPHSSPFRFITYDTMALYTS